MSRLVVAAAGAYAALAFTGTALAVDREAEAAFLGIRTGWPMVVDVAVGYGTAFAAGWPIVLTLVLAGDRVRTGSRQAATVVIVVAALCSLGQLAEPIFWDLATASSVDPAALAMGIGNVLTPLVALGAAVRLRQAEDPAGPPAR